MALNMDPLGIDQNSLQGASAVIQTEPRLMPQ